MIIKNSGFEIDKFFVPPFELRKGELLNLFIFGGGHFFDLEKKLTTIFLGKEKKPEITVYQPLSFVENFYDFSYRKFFFSVTVRDFLKTTANLEQVDPSLFIGELDTNQNTRLITMPYYERRLLGLLSALSRSQNIVFDLSGLDPLHSISFLKRIKKILTNGGSAILINNFDDQAEKEYYDQDLTIEQRP